MKKGVVLLNTGRGGLVDEKALYDAVTSGHVRGVGLDVFSKEPPDNEPLLELHNVLATPHIATHTVESNHRMGVVAATNIINYFEKNKNKIIGGIKMNKIKGSLTPNITFFKEDNTIDFEKCKWHMEWMFENGIHGLFLTGSYGAGPLMTNEERISIFKLAKEVQKNYPETFLMAHVGCADTASTVELAKAAQELGMDAVGAVPPFYYGYEEPKIISFYQDIVEAVDIPVYAYNNPFTTKTTMTLNTVRKLQEIGVKGVKDSSMSVAFITNVFYDAKLNNKNFQTIIGTSTGWLPFYQMGIDTMIAGMGNYAPEIITALYNHTVSGDLEKAERVYRIMMDYQNKVKFTDSTIASHIVLKARGFDCGQPRLPMSLPSFDDAIYEKMAKETKAAIDAALAVGNEEVETPIAV